MLTFRIMRLKSLHLPSIQIEAFPGFRTRSVVIKSTISKTIERFRFFYILVNKSLTELIEPLSDRIKGVQDFLSSVNR